MSIVMLRPCLFLSVHVQVQDIKMFNVTHILQIVVVIH